MTDGAVLDTCGCCAQEPCICATGGSVNRPGLPAIRYRLGTHSTFLRTLIDGLPGQIVTDEDGETFRPLAQLTARGTDDPSIALLDAFAVVCDVLTFYQERIANEGYLRTATERRSVLELAREIGYELNPGVASASFLAFTVEDAPSAPKQATVPVGTRVQSVPGPGEQPQVFETVAASMVRAEWNAISALQSHVQRVTIQPDATLQLDGVPTWQIDLAGTGLNVKQGDAFLVVQGVRVRPFTITRVTEDGATSRTRVEVGPSLPPPVPSLPSLPQGVVTQEPIAQTLASVKHEILDKAWDDEDLTAMLAAQRWDGPTLLTQVQTLLAADVSDTEVFTFRQRVGFFGASAPAYASLAPDPSQPKATKPRGWPRDWDDPPISIWRDGTVVHTPRNPDADLLSTTTGKDVFLDQEVPELTADSWAVFYRPPEHRTYRIVGVSVGTRADFALSAKTTGLDLASPRIPSSHPRPASTLEGVRLYDPPAKPPELGLRKTVAYVLSKRQVLAPSLYVEPIQARVTDKGVQRLVGASYITLDRMVLGLAVGQPVMVSGIEAGDANTASTGVARWEVAILGRIVHAKGRTTLYFRQALAYRYVRAGCTINANVILASHGETVASEVLGSGDGALANQSFVLRKKPLTYVPAANPSGSESTLDVKVNGISWSEVPSLFAESPRSQSYVVRHGEDGATTIEFGDGLHGARLPSGQENLVARYRTGIGPDGNVRARALSLLLNPPLGVRSAVNPNPAQGGAAPEPLADARRNAPLTVLTLDRIVSLPDFEDFAHGFAGIGKARAHAIWSGERRVVFLSVTDASGKQLDPSLPLYTNLVAALATLSDGTDEIQVGSIDPVSLTLRSFIERRFRIAADVRVDPAFDSAAVLDQVTDALLTAFGFDARALGQHVTEAEVILAIQNVPGVVFTRLTRLGDALVPALPDGAVLVAATAGWAVAGGKPWIRPDELLLVSPTGIALTEIKS
jgi:hypothetical protein